MLFLFALGTVALVVSVLREEYGWSLGFIVALGILSATVVILVIRLSPQSRAVLESQAVDERMQHYRNAEVTRSDPDRSIPGSD